MNAEESVERAKTTRTRKQDVNRKVRKGRKQQDIQKVRKPEYGRKKAWNTGTLSPVAGARSEDTKRATCAT